MHIRESMHICWAHRQSMFCTQRKHVLHTEKICFARRKSIMAHRESMFGTQRKKRKYVVHGESMYITRESILGTQ